MTLPTDYQTYIHQSRYARWQEYLNRRETWEETVDRYISFFEKREMDVGRTDINFEELKEAILNQGVMPSMRCLMTAGKALERDNVAGYNCAYAAVDNPKVFDEIMYVLCCGTGIGFSVEQKYIEQLPSIAEVFHDTDTIIKVRDSKIGWATAYREMVSLLYAGKIPQWDVSGVRPKGARLKTFGGRASGPAPLVELFEFTIEAFKKAAGRRLTSIECHDIVCKIADIVVVGGIRRSALLSLSNLTDERMRHAKSGAWWEANPQRALANNSVCYTSKPDPSIFLKEWRALYESKSGERGVFNRQAAIDFSPERRDRDFEFGTNPCSEIILRSKQFCNLTEVVVRAGDTLDDLKRKVRYATILGTLQATLTDFRYLSKEWERNTREEALLGVSLTGIMDHLILSGSDTDELKDWLNELREVAIETNKKWSSILGINSAAAITCVKPSGTVSQLVDSASGIHPRYSQYYVRRVRGDAKDPITQLLKDQGVLWEHEIGKEGISCVFNFPMKAPDRCVTRNEIDAMQQLELWKIYQENWCEHKPSITVYYKEDEFIDVGSWVYRNFDMLSGVSFLPHTDHVYKQAPYEEITEEQYNDLIDKMPKIDFTKLSDYEKEDSTDTTKELACSAGSCEVL